VNLQCGKIQSLSLDIRQIYRILVQNNETRLREDHLSRSAIQIELPNERPFSIPNMGTLAATWINVPHSIKLNTIGNTRIRVGEHSAVCKRLRLWINVELVAMCFTSESHCNYDRCQTLTSWTGGSDSFRKSLQKNQCLCWSIVITLSADRKTRQVPKTYTNALLPS